MPYTINDSTIVRYIWDGHSKTLQGQYSQSKISKAQILTYYLGDNDLLFINTHYTLLKNTLLDKDKKASALYYLNQVKNYYVRK